MKGLILSFCRSKPYIDVSILVIWKRKIGNKLPQDALNPAHASLLTVNSHSSGTLFSSYNSIASVSSHGYEIYFYLVNGGCNVNGPKVAKFLVG